ncbi:MAG: hypothetical protein ACREQ5_07185 [Candidatus Dormibacteria bacterium]
MPPAPTSLDIPKDQQTHARGCPFGRPYNFEASQGKEQRINSLPDKPIDFPGLGVHLQDTPYDTLGILERLV